MDLLSLFDTCKRLRSIAAQTFSLVHQEIDINEILLSEFRQRVRKFNFKEILENFRSGKSERIELALTTKFLKAFGNMITGIEFELGPSNENLKKEYSDIIVRYYSGTLKSFELTVCKTIKPLSIFMNKLRPLFVNLESFSLSRNDK